MKNLAFLICVTCLHIGTAHAQTDPLYAQYLNNPLLINPGYTGFHNNFDASVTYRKQWAGFDGSPETVNVTAHSSTGENMGLGLFILSDKAGVNKNTEVMATYAYRLDLENKFLSFGLQGGITNYRIDNSGLNVYDPDGVEFQANQNLIKPAFGAGVMLHSDRYLIGLSVPRLLKSTHNINGESIDLYQQHFYLTGAYVFFLSDQVRLKPSVLVKAVSGAPVSIDYNVLFNFEEKYSAGIYTRNLNTYGLLAQLKLGNNYRLGYAFEMPSDKSVGTRFTSHEVCIGVNLSVLDFHDAGEVSSF